MNFGDFFVYDESSPSCLRWKVDRYGGRRGTLRVVSAGDVAGWINSAGYYRVGLDNTHYSCHRIIYELKIGELHAKDIVDHLDRDKLNNRVSNLRKVSIYENARNRSKHKNNVSGSTGVCKVTTHGGKYVSWLASAIGVDGRPVSKAFSTARYGDEEALRMAQEYRQSLIQQANAKGAGYTQTHGT